MPAELQRPKMHSSWTPSTSSGQACPFSPGSGSEDCFEPPTVTQTLCYYGNSSHQHQDDSPHWEKSSESHVTIPPHRGDFATGTNLWTISERSSINTIKTSPPHGTSKNCFIPAQPQSFDGTQRYGYGNAGLRRRDRFSLDELTLHKQRAVGNV